MNEREKERVYIRNVMSLLEKFFFRVFGGHITTWSFRPWLLTRFVLTCFCTFNKLFLVYNTTGTSGRFRGPFSPVSCSCFTSRTHMRCVKIKAVVNLPLAMTSIFFLDSTCLFSFIFFSHACLLWLRG